MSGLVGASNGEKRPGISSVRSPIIIEVAKSTSSFGMVSKKACALVDIVIIASIDM